MTSKDGIQGLSILSWMNSTREYNFTMLCIHYLGASSTSTFIQIARVMEESLAQA